MTTLFIILVIIACVILSFIVLIQNPKGGGLAGNIAGVSSQFMGVKQTNDILERGTWIFAAVIGLLSLLATFFLGGSSASSNGRLDNIGTNAPVQQTAPKATTPANTTTLPGAVTPAPATADTTKK